MTKSGAYSNRIDIRCKATDGTVFWVKAGAGPEYFLHPVFLHYFACCIGIYVLLDPTSLIAHLPVGWFLTVGWLVFCITALATLSLISWLIAAAERRGWPGTIYTPFVFMPMLIAGHIALATFGNFVSDKGPVSLETLILIVAKSIFTTVIFDILHARYVVLAHPYADTEAPPKAMPPGQTLPDPAPDAIPSTAPTPDSAAPPDDSIRIGTLTFALPDILTIRTRDHRLEVTTRDGATLQRARMSDLPETTLARHGIQISRSLWIAFDAITDVVETQPNQTDLRLWTGEVERVAKPRLHAFRQAWRVRNAADGMRDDRQNPARSAAGTQQG